MPAGRSGLSAILSDRMEERQVTEDGPRAGVLSSPPPPPPPISHFLFSFSFLLLSHDALVCRVASTAEDTWLQTTRDPTHAPHCEACVAGVE